MAVWPMLWSSSVLAAISAFSGLKFLTVDTVVQ